MKNLILTLSTLILTHCMFSQTLELTGQWTFDQVQAGQELDEKSTMMVKMMFDGMYLAFDGQKYEQSMMGKVEVGTWLDDEDGIYFISSNGYEYVVGLEQESENTLLFSHNKMKLVLQKTADTFKIEDFVDNLDKVEGIAIDTNLLKREWNWVGTVKKDGSDAPALKHAKDVPVSYHFKEGSVFENKAPFGITTYAYWLVSDDLQYLIFQSEERNEYYKVMKLDKGSLELYNPKDESVLRFAKK